jgi:hypothetical protein
LPYVIQPKRYLVHIFLEELRTLLTSKSITGSTRVQYLNFFLGPTVVNFSTRSNASRKIKISLVQEDPNLKKSIRTHHKFSFSYSITVLLAAVYPGTCAQCTYMLAIL